MSTQLKARISADEEIETLPPPLVLRVSIANLRLEICGIEKKLETLGAALDLVTVGEVEAPWNGDSDDRARDAQTSRLVRETEDLRERCTAIATFIADLTRSIAV